MLGGAMRSRSAAVLVVTALALLALPAARPAAAQASSAPRTRGVSFVDQQVEAGILLLQGYINTQGANNGFVFPAKAIVKKGGGLVAPIWPANPWTGKIMAPGTGRGIFTYTLTSAAGTAYKLVGHLSKGSFTVKGGTPKWLTAERTQADDQITALAVRMLKGYVDIWGLQKNGAPPAQAQMTSTGDVEINPRLLAHQPLHRRRDARARRAGRLQLHTRHRRSLHTQRAPLQRTTPRPERTGALRLWKRAASCPHGQATRP